jgi:hypothetical protein
VCGGQWGGGKRFAPFFDGKLLEKARSKMNKDSTKRDRSFVGWLGRVFWQFVMQDTVELFDKHPTLEGRVTRVGDNTGLFACDDPLTRTKSCDGEANTPVSGVDERDVYHVHNVNCPAVWAHRYALQTMRFFKEFLNIPYTDDPVTCIANCVGAQSLYQPAVRQLRLGCTPSGFQLSRCPDYVGHEVAHAWLRDPLDCPNPFGFGGEAKEEGLCDFFAVLARTWDLHEGFTFEDDCRWGAAVPDSGFQRLLRPPSSSSEATTHEDGRRLSGALASTVKYLQENGDIEGVKTFLAAVVQGVKVVGACEPLLNHLLLVSFANEPELKEVTRKQFADNKICLLT